MRISDWSSDVCSSDLPICVEDAGDPHLATAHSSVIERQSFSRPLALVVTGARAARIDAAAILLALAIGSASCRGRVCPYVSVSVVAVSLQEKKTRHT